MLNWLEKRRLDLLDVVSLAIMVVLILLLIYHFLFPFSLSRALSRALSCSPFSSNSTWIYLWRTCFCVLLFRYIFLPGFTEHSFISNVTHIWIEQYKIKPKTQAHAWLSHAHINRAWVCVSYTQTTWREWMKRFWKCPCNIRIYPLQSVEHLLGCAFIVVVVVVADVGGGGGVV